VLLLTELLKDSGEGTNNDLGAMCSRSFWQTLSQRGVTGSKRKKDLLYFPKSEAGKSPRKALFSAENMQNFDHIDVL